MATKQPTWELVAQLGDAHPLEHGGYYVYRDITGVYAPEAEWLDVPDDDGNAEKATAYRFILEPCTYVDGILSDNPYHPSMPAWFADDLTAIANANGMPEAGLIRLFCSNDPRERAEAWRCVGLYYGFHELDHYPRTFDTMDELEKRYDQRGLLDARQMVEDGREPQELLDMQLCGSVRETPDDGDDA